MLPEIYHKVYEDMCETMRDTKKGGLDKNWEYFKYKVSKKDRKDMLKTFVAWTLIWVYEELSYVSKRPTLPE